MRFERVDEDSHSSSASAMSSMRDPIAHPIARCLQAAPRLRSPRGASVGSAAVTRFGRSCLPRHSFALDRSLPWLHGEYLDAGREVVDVVFPEKLRQPIVEIGRGLRKDRQIVPARRSAAPARIVGSRRATNGLALDFGIDVEVGFGVDDFDGGKAGVNQSLLVFLDAESRLPRSRRRPECPGRLREGSAF